MWFGFPAPWFAYSWSSPKTGFPSKPPKAALQGQMLRSRSWGIISKICTLKIDTIYKSIYIYILQSVNVTHQSILWRPNWKNTVPWESIARLSLYHPSIDRSRLTFVPFESWNQVVELKKNIYNSKLESRKVLREEDDRQPDRHASRFLIYIVILIIIPYINI